MKDFLITFIIVLVLLYVFLFFGGVVLFDFSGHFWLAVVSCAFLASIVIYAFFRQSEKMEELENRIKTLEDEKKGVE